MCTHYTLSYKCGHQQTSLRCPGSLITHTTADGGTASLVLRCADKYYLAGELDDDCMSCKMNKGLTPGGQTGFDAWAELEVKRTAPGLGLSVRKGEVPLAGMGVEKMAGSPVVEGRKGVKRRRISGAGDVDPRLLGQWEQAAAVPLGGQANGNAPDAWAGGPDPNDDCEFRLRAALDEARDGNGNLRLSVSGSDSDSPAHHSETRSDTLELPTTPKAPVTQQSPLINQDLNASKIDPALENENMSLFGEAMEASGHNHAETTNKTVVDWSWGGSMQGFDRIGD